MFDTTSRYASLETASYTAAEGQTIPYKRRRFLPRGASLQLLTEVTTSQDDRLDLITARTLGDPEQFWRVCDANDAMNPFDLVAEPGLRLKVPVPQP